MKNSNEMENFSYTFAQASKRREAATVRLAMPLSLSLSKDETDKIK